MDTDPEVLKNNKKEDINFDELNDADIDFDKDEKDEIKVNDVKVNNEREVLGVKLPNNDLIEKTKLKLSILRYKDIFGAYLTHYGDRLNVENLDTLDNETLSSLIDEIRITVGCRNSASMISNSYFGLAGFVENLGPSIGLELQGLQASLMNSKMIVETLQEISLEYESLAYIPPIQRLVLGTGQILIGIHSLNQSNKKIQSFSNDKIKQDIVNKFDDL